MKKVKLYSALVAGLLAVAMNASAQKDITSTYIKNATLSSLDGWTNANFNTPKQGNNTKGYASESYAGWGSLEKTAYSLKQDITLPEGSYRLVNYSFYREGEAYNTDAATSRCKLLAGDASVDIKTLGSITTAGYANSQVEGANAFDSKMYRNYVDFTIPSGGKTITIGLDGTFEQMRSWIIAGMFELFDMNEVATAESPTDVTYLITNPGGEYRDMTGWTLSEKDAFGAQGNTSFDNKAGGYYMEKWQASGGLSDRSMSQTLTDLKAGYYTLSAYSYYGGTGAKLFIGDNETEITASKSGLYSVSASVAEDGGSLNLGFKLENGTANWVCVDRFSLSYFDPSTVYAGFKVFADSAAVLSKNYMSKSVLEALNNASKYPSDDASIDDWTKATSALQIAIDNANASIAAYTALNTNLTYFAKKSWATDETYDPIYDAAKKVYDEATSDVAAVNASTATLTVNDYRTYCKAIIKNYQTATALGATWDNVGTGWEYTTGAINHGSLNNSGNYDINGNSMWENWSGNGLDGDMKQTITVPNGKYFLKMVSFTRNSINANDYIYIKSGNNTSTAVSTGTTSNAFLNITDPIEVTNNTVEIGLHIGSGADWAAIGGVELYTYSVADMTRETAAGKYGTICFPYAFTPNNAKVYSATLNGNSLDLTEVTSPVAGIPYIYEATGNNPSFARNGSDAIVSAPVAAEPLVGVFKATTAPEGSYVLQTQDNVQQFYIVNSNDITVPAYKAYVVASSGAKSLSFRFAGEETTGINALNALVSGNAKIYDINGRQLKSLQKGVNIVNGTKVVVK